MNTRPPFLAASLALLAMDASLPHEPPRPVYRRESKPGKGGKRRTRVIKGAEYQRRPSRSR